MKSFVISIALCFAARAATGQTLSAVAHTPTGLIVQADRGPGANVAPGTVLPNGFLARDAGPFSADWAQAGVTLLTTPRQVVYTLLEDCSVSASFVNQGSWTGIHDTVLTVTSSAPVPARIRITWSGNGDPIGRTAPSVDLGDDGALDWTGSMSPPFPQVVTLDVHLGVAPLPIRTTTGTVKYLSQTLGSNPYGMSHSDLQIEVVSGGAFHAGGNQWAAAGEPFPQPLTVQVLDPLGAPAVGVPVSFQLPGGSLSATVVTTDAAGLASVTATAGGSGGVLTATATVQGQLPFYATSLYVNELDLQRSASGVAMAVTSGMPPSGPVPYILLTSPLGIAPLATAFGLLATNPFDPSTVVLEDSIGFFGGFSLDGAGAVGAPSLAKFYPLPAGFLAGLTLQFQAVGLDPNVGLFLTNAANLTF